jgi:hypothetical protein
LKVEVACEQGCSKGIGEGSVDDFVDHFSKRERERERDEKRDFLLCNPPPKKNFQKKKNMGSWTGRAPPCSPFLPFFYTILKKIDSLEEVLRSAKTKLTHPKSHCLRSWEI